MAEEIYEYKTIVPSKSFSLYKEKGSKFLGYIFRVSSEEEVSKNLDFVKSEHPQARHICYAYTYGIDQKTFKANDDGEPNNSAGMPIYNQILSFNLDDILIAVVRYFGGTKLGVSGLINAYKTTAKMSIEDSKIITIERQLHTLITCNYNQLSSVYHYLNTHTCQIIKQEMQEDCKIWVDFPLKNKDEVVRFFNEQAFDLKIIDNG